MSAEVLLATGYAAMLLVGAFVLERLSVHTNDRSKAMRTGGFEYDEHHDYWVCQQGEQLWPAEFDREKRLVRYRAKSSACRVCEIKDLCTDSDRGREITRAIDPWPHSEAGRFHRGIAVMIVALALFVLVVVMVRNHGPLDLAVLLPAGAVALWANWWLGRDLLHTPSGFPEAMPAHGNRIGSGPADGPGAGAHAAEGAEPLEEDELKAEEPGIPRFGRTRTIRWQPGREVNGHRAEARKADPPPGGEQPDEPYGRGATITAE